MTRPAFAEFDLWMIVESLKVRVARHVFRHAVESSSDAHQRAAALIASTPIGLLDAVVGNVPRVDGPAGAAWLREVACGVLSVSRMDYDVPAAATARCAKPAEGGVIVTDTARSLSLPEPLLVFAEDWGRINGRVMVVYAISDVHAGFLGQWKVKSSELLVNVALEHPRGVPWTIGHELGHACDPHLLATTDESRERFANLMAEHFISVWPRTLADVAPVVERLCADRSLMSAADKAAALWSRTGNAMWFLRQPLREWPPAAAVQDPTQTEAA